MLRSLEDYVRQAEVECHIDVSVHLIISDPKIYTETCPQYLTLTAEDLQGLNMEGGRVPRVDARLVAGLE